MKLVWENMHVSSNLPFPIYPFIIHFKWNNATYTSQVLHDSLLILEERVLKCHIKYPLLGNTTKKYTLSSHPKDSFSVWDESYTHLHFVCNIGCQLPTWRSQIISRVTQKISGEHDKGQVCSIHTKIMLLRKYLFINRRNSRLCVSVSVETT